MTLLPIVERELRVAARKRSTFWVRVAAASVALVIGCGFLITAMAGTFPFSPSSYGKGLFTVLTWLGLAVALSAGLFFTSDCLSEEKREGTLGFLFLTDVRGYDVVFGKLLATSLRAICGLLAVFPILAVTLLMGGVTGAQFWRTVLALVNALFISLAAGLFISAISRDAQKALSATLLLLVLLVGGGPLIDSVIAGVSSTPFNAVLSFSSPAVLFTRAGAWAQPPILPGLITNQAIGWTLIALTCALLPRTWQERGLKSTAPSKGWTSRSLGRRQARKLSAKMLTSNPVLWLAYRQRWQRIPIWIVTILLASGSALLLSRRGSWEWMIWSYLASALSLALYLGIASQAGRFFVEAQRNGFLELLLATPLTVNQFVQGQWHALLRLFAAPVGLCLVAHVLGGYMAQREQMSLMAGRPAVPTVATKAAATNVIVVTSRTASSTTTTTVSVGGITAPNRFVLLAISLSTTIIFLANLCALSWFGMWMGLTSKNTNVATLKTIAFVQIIPWFVITFASSMIIPLVLLPKLMSRAPSVSAQAMVWYSMLSAVVAFILNVGKDVGFFYTARQKLYSEFRQSVIQGAAPTRLPRPPATERV